MVTINIDKVRELLLSTTNANGGGTEYKYDDLDRPTATYIDGKLIASAEYGVSGDVRVKDEVTGKSTTTTSDLISRTGRIDTSDGNSTTFQYDKNGNIQSVITDVFDQTISEIHSYDAGNRLYNSQISGLGIGTSSLTVNREFDNIGNVKQVNYQLPIKNPTNPDQLTYNRSVKLGYESSLFGKTSLLTSMQNGSDTPYSYTLNNSGKLASVKQEYNRSYEYDDLGQLTRDNDEKLNQTNVYKYDNYGNIQSETKYLYTTGAPSGAIETKNYTYSNSWKDQLSEFDGKAITYDNMGNPLSIGDRTFKWIEGNFLDSVSDNTNTISYKYDAYGQRTQKIINGKKTEYLTIQNRLAGIIEDGQKYLFVYSGVGQRLGMTYRDNIYYYLYDGQSNVVALMDDSGKKVVEYIYDSWGNHKASGSMADTLGKANPFRYRNYMFDEETGYYYLESRFYSPELHRFINSDLADFINDDFGGLNLYAYCLNDPIGEVDPSGYISNKEIKSLLKDFVENTKEANKLAKSKMYFHNKVQKDFIAENPSWDMEVQIMQKNGKVGRMDLYNPTTGEVLEVKPITVAISPYRTKQAIKQIEGYLGGKSNLGIVANDINDYNKTRSISYSQYSGSFQDPKTSSSVVYKTFQMSDNRYRGIVFYSVTWGGSPQKSSSSSSISSAFSKFAKAFERISVIPYVGDRAKPGRWY